MFHPAHLMPSSYRCGIDDNARGVFFLQIHKYGTVTSEKIFWILDLVITCSFWYPPFCKSYKRLIYLSLFFYTDYVIIGLCKSLPPFPYIKTIEVQMDSLENIS